jgi:phospholipid transport system substrate-binding protein
MILRRDFLMLAASAALLPLAHAARAQSMDKASTFVKATGDRLVAVVNGGGSADTKRSAMTTILTDAVDVDGIARFCLGRFWRTATPAQQTEYVQLFHQVLVNNITAKLGEYQGVSFTMGRARMDGESGVVSTTVNRPNNPATAVDWIVSDPASSPKIIDVVAEGTSLRLTQRQDYASYLTHNNNSVDALIAAMKKQLTQGS